MTMKQQEPPFAIQIEPVEGCTLACSFCALQAIRTNGADSIMGVHGKSSAPYKMMELGMADTIANAIRLAGWTSRIEFAMHGEPTVHRNLALIIQIFRDALPKTSLMLTTNGSGLKTIGDVAILFQAGLNTLAFDKYDHAPWRERAEKVLLAYEQEVYKEFTIDIPVLRYPSDKKANPHQRFHGMRIIVIQDISKNTNGTHKLTNQGGNSGDLGDDDKGLEQRCAKPFRELSFRWDGSVALCCDDWKGNYKIGNIRDFPSITALWNTSAFQAARVALYNAKRTMIGVCSGCNVRTYRNGLLPDKMGKETLAEVKGRAAEVVRAEIRKAESGSNYS